MNPTYKNLETKMRISGLTLGQWVQLVVCGFAALLFALYLSPFRVGPTLAVSVLLGGLPIAVSYGLSGADFSATELASSVWRWARRAKRYQAGPGAGITGYQVDHPPPEPRAERSMNGHATLDLETLWER
jgi:hypothetical protein